MSCQYRLTACSAPLRIVFLATPAGPTQWLVIILIPITHNSKDPQILTYFTSASDNLALEQPTHQELYHLGQSAGAGPHASVLQQVHQCIDKYALTLDVHKSGVGP